MRLLKWIRLLPERLRRGYRNPEARFVVEVTPADEIACRAPDQPEQRIAMAQLAAVYVETNDSGPWGMDVWWLLTDAGGQTRVAFPQLATGEDAVLERLNKLPGFQVNGMHSTQNARFQCWLSPARDPSVEDGRERP